MNRQNTDAFVNVFLTVILTINEFCGGFVSEKTFAKKYFGIYFSDGHIKKITVRSLTDCSKTCAILDNCFSFSKRSDYCILFDRCPDVDVDNSTSDGSSITYCRDYSVTTSPVSSPRDCREIFENGQTGTGEYKIQITVNLEKSVICDMDTQNGAWTVIQTRHDGSVDFYRSWDEYKNGFGSTETEYWIGNEAIYQLVSLYSDTELYIEMEDWNTDIKFSLYDDFSLDSEAQYYKIYVSGYSGTSGDCIDYYDASPGGSRDRFTHNGMKFSTWDQDNDNHVNVNCADTMKGGWWYSECLASNLNGLYLSRDAVDSTSMSCKAFGGDYRSLKRVKMMIRGVS